MLKRKRDESLAQEVLEQKCDFLRSKGITIPGSDSEHPDQDWDYLLDVCLAFEKAYGTSAVSRIMDSETIAAEQEGNYDHLSLQTESLEDACSHATYQGPVMVSKLEAPKLQGVVAARDILKGELLCTSVPQIVVPNLAPVEDPTDLLFSDLSLAEMTAKLLLLSKNQEVKENLQALEFAGKDQVKDDWRSMCREIVGKYTWAIDHPGGADDDSKKQHTVCGRKTKVAGHAFTINGLAGMFNHSCVPNATMVSYGAVQFFYANCSIKKGIEICASYGYDGLDAVSTRRRKLMIHAGFECTCPLCLFESDVRNRPTHVAKDKSHHCTAFEVILLDTLHGGVYPEVLTGKSTTPPPSLSLVKDALWTTAQLMDDLPEVQHLTENLSILQILSLYPRLLSAAEDCSSSPSKRDSSTSILRHCILLSSMFIALSLDRPPEVGIAFGDLFRPRIQALAKILEGDAWQTSCRQHKLRDDFAQGSWWQAKKLEYTDCF